MQTDISIGSLADKTPLEQWNAYMLTQLQIRKKHEAQPDSRPPGPAITISRQAGSGAHEIAARLAVILQAAEPDEAPRWTVFDRNLLAKVLEDNHLPQSLADLMPEDHRSLLHDVIEELLQLRPPSWVIVPQITETVLHLADTGHAILVGRGANCITARMPNVFHVRLIAPLEKRIERVQRLHNLTPEEAAKYVARSDRARGRYVKTHFRASVSDDLLYHVVINTDRISCPDAAQLIADGARRYFQTGADGTKVQE